MLEPTEYPLLSPPCPTTEEKLRGPVRAPRGPEDTSKRCHRLRPHRVAKCQGMRFLDRCIHLYVIVLGCFSL